jgi:hypothetical protein
VYLKGRVNSRVNGGLDYFATRQAFAEKAESKGVDYKRLGTILNEREDTIGRLLEIRLKHQAKELPHLEKVLRETRQLLRRYEII